MKLMPAFITFLILAGRLHAQQDNQPPTDYIAWVNAEMDSLRWFITNGQVRHTGNECQVPGHHQFITNNGLNFSEKALTVNGNEKKAFVEMYALNSRATNFYNKRDYINSTLYWQKALVIATTNHFSFESLHLFRPALNNNFFLAGDYTNAMKISSDGLAESENIRDSNRIAHFDNVIGYIHMKQKNFVQANQYFLSDLQLSEKSRDTLSEAHALYNLADLSIAEQDFDKAISYLQQSLAVYRSFKKPGFFTLSDREAFIYNKMAEAYKLKKDYRAALPFALLATAIAGKQFAYINDYDEASYYINTGDIYNCLSLPDSAIFFLRHGMNIAKRIIHREYIRDASQQLAIAFSKKKIFDSAYLYQSFYSGLKDSIEKESNQQEILQREAMLKIDQQKQLQKAALEKQKLWRNIIIGIALFLLMTLAFLYNRYRLRQKNRYQQQLNKQQNELFNAIANTQDQERKRIAEDIHDSLGSILSAAKLQLSALKEGSAPLSPVQQEKHRVAMQLLDEASAELRNVSHNIMPATLSKLGLVAALKNLINHISPDSGLQISFSAHDFIQRIDEKTEMSIYRIVLELINNIVKHAAATKVTVQLIRYPDYINLSVEDNGRGFDYENELELKKGIGLGNILSRIDYLNGKLNVDTAAGRGTAVIIDIPYTGG